MNISVNGPKILFEIPILGGIPITETIINGWIVVTVISVICFVLGRNLSTRNPSKKQILAEKAVLMLQNLIKNTMGETICSFFPTLVHLSLIQC